MMRNTWLVARIMLKMQYTSTGKRSNAWIYILLALILIPFLILFLNIFQSVIIYAYDILSEVNQESMLLGLALISIALILLFFSIIMILSSFYFSDDITAYIPLPVHPYQLLIGKAANPVIYNYLLSALLFLPFLFIYGNVSNASFLFYIYGLVLFLVFPLIPFFIAAIILMFIMRYVNISKNKDRSKIWMGIGSLLFVILINVFIRLNVDEAAFIESLTVYMHEKEGLMRMITAIYPPAFLGASSLHLAHSFIGFLYLLAVVSTSVIGAFLFIGSGQQFYLKGVRGMSSGSKGTLSDKAANKINKQQTIWKTYMLKELKIIFRTPAFLMQCVIQALFFPVFLTVILFLDLGEGLPLLAPVAPEKNLFLILFMLSIVMLSINITASTAISREGASRKLNLFLPLPLNTLIYTKLLVAYLISFIPFILIVGVGIYVNIPISILLGWIGISLLYNWLTVIINFIVDIRSPKLHWTDEQELFKGRFTPFFISVAQTAFFGVLTAGLWHTNMNVYLIMFLLLIIVLSLTVIMHWYLRKKVTWATLQNLGN